MYFSIVSSVWSKKRTNRYKRIILRVDSLKRESDITILCMSAVLRWERTTTRKHSPQSLVYNIFTSSSDLFTLEAKVYKFVHSRASVVSALSEDSSREIEWKRRLKGRAACLRPRMGARYPGQRHPRTRRRRAMVTRVTKLVCVCS